MISYELAKQLKDAGFPKKIVLGMDAKEVADRMEKGLFVEVPEYPTLSELIEACGNGFTGLFRTTNYSSKNQWLAENDTKNGSSHHGETAEEAVANLWLALNKK